MIFWVVVLCVFFIVKFSVSWFPHNLIYFYTLGCYAYLLLLLLLLFCIVLHPFCLLFFGLRYRIWIFNYLLIYYISMFRLSLNYFGRWSKLIQIIDRHASFGRLTYHHWLFFIWIFRLIRQELLSTTKCCCYYVCSFLLTSSRILVF